MADANTSTLNNSGSVMLGVRVEIFPSMPLPDLNTLGGQAYAARFKTEASTDLFAIVCTSGMPPRIESTNAMRSVDHPSIVRFIDSGVISWGNGSQAYALIYARPSLPRMMTSLEETTPIMSEDAINHHFITPMIGALNALMISGLVHNALRPNNIFWRIGNAAPPQIGECLSTPAGLGQPVLFEPVERALANPLGRGPGVHADDCYAFGITLALLVLGRNPLQGMSDEAIIDLKMQRGTFAAMIGTNRLLPTHIELLRGLLADDARQRWTGAHLEQWLSGRRMTPKSSDAGRRASRHFTFAGKEYWQLAPLANAFAGNVEEAAKIIENDSLAKWLRRSLNDEERADDVQAVIAALKQSGKSAHYEDQLVARVCMALDHAAPIRYRGLSVMPTGIPPLLVEAALTGGNVGILSEMIATQLISLWVEMQKDVNPEYIAMVQTFDRMKTLVDKSSWGNGIERITYELNPGLPCLSPMLRSYYVTSPKMLLAALEKLAGTGNRPRDPMDRHIAAFLLVRDKRSEATFLPLAAPEGSMRRGIGILTLLAELHYRYGPERVPQLAARLAPIGDLSLRRFLSKSLREKLHKQIKEAIAVGNLSLYLNLLDDPRRIERDRQDFMAARILYLNIQKEMVGLDAKVNNRESVVQAAGKPMAASISSFLAIVLIFIALVRSLLENLFF